MTPKIDTSYLVRHLSNSHNIIDIYRGHKGIKVNEVKPKRLPFSESEITERWIQIANSGSHNGQIAAVDPKETYIQGDTLVVACYPSSFRDYKVTLDHPSTRVWLTGTTGLVRFQHQGESHYLFGNRRRGTSNIGGALELLPGGFINASALKLDHPYERTLKREFEEETGMPEDYISVMTPLEACFIRKGAPKNPRLFQDMTQGFLVDLQDGIVPEDIQRLFKQYPRVREHTNIQIVPHSNLIQFISNNLDRLSIVSKFKLENFLRDV
jgi:8-oxo-dGTP pyrophosphatase MutT (NUDIX family)